jgi:hypothetical protein
MSTITTVGERGKDAVVMEIAEPWPGVHVARIVEQDDERIARGEFRFSSDVRTDIRSHMSPYWSPSLGSLCLRGTCVQADHGTFDIGPAADRDRVVAAVTELNRSLRRKRKVQVEAWANVYPEGTIHFWRLKKNAEWQSACSTVVRLTGEYEVDE